MEQDWSKLNLNMEIPLSAKKVIEEQLVSPTSEFLSRPQKGVRSALVQLGYVASDQEETQDMVDQLSEIIESIHSGSLIVDDIQDNSEVRREKPSLHKLVGIPSAINAGNWLYFSALRSVSQMQLNEDKKNRILQILHDMLFNGHVGQALDIGVRINDIEPTDVPDLCRTTMQLKTGELMAASVLVGAELGGHCVELSKTLYEISIELGFILQIFDDLKVLKPRMEGELSDLPTKNLEDLVNLRPCFAWQFASEHSDANCFQDLKMAASSLPDLRPLSEWIEKYQIHKITTAELELKKTSLLNLIDRKFGPAGFHRPKVKPIIESLIEKLERAYEQN